MSRGFWPQIWGVAQITASGIHRGIRPYEKSAHFLVCSSAKKVCMSTIQADISATLFFTVRHDCACVFGIVVDSISVCLELEIKSGVFPDCRDRYSQAGNDMFSSLGRTDKSILPSYKIY